MHAPHNQHSPIAAAKKETRRRLFARRRGLLADDRARFNAALRSHLVRFLKEQEACTVAAYSPLGSEPGGPELVSALAESGLEVWLPISLPDGELEWALFTGTDNMDAGALGISEPIGARRGNELLQECDVIIVPALAANAAGVRLGKGGGYYDRALATAPSTTRIVVLYDHELGVNLPVEKHDVATGWAVTPSGVHAFPCGKEGTVHPSAPVQ